MTDDQPSHVADDAVSNRSDDTALEEANGRSAAEDTATSHGAPEAAASHGGGESEEVSSVSSEEELIEESAAAEAEEEVTEEDEAEPVEDENSPAAIARRKPVELASDEPEEIRMDWYILKVQSNRERTIAEALERKMRIEGYDRFFDQVVVPTEKVTEFKGGKKKVVERKLYPGYIVVHMHINDDTWFAVRETSGVGDFTGAGGKPTPMLASEVSRIIQKDVEETSESPKLDIKFAVGDKIKVKEGNFENFEGEVAKIDEASGRVTVLIHIFGRSTQVELEYWQIEAV
jgi:transcription termination/antitermination protein NusG